MFTNKFVYPDDENRLNPGMYIIQLGSMKHIRLPNEASVLHNKSLLNHYELRLQGANAYTCTHNRSFKITLKLSSGDEFSQAVLKFYIVPLKNEFSKQELGQTSPN